MAIADTFPNGLRVKQVVGALRIQQERRVLLADQPGAGKTAQALVAAELDGLFNRPSAILILCNVTGCQLTWAGELQKRVASQYEVVIADLTDTAGKKTMPSVAKRNDALAYAMLEASDLELPLIVLANYELVRWNYKTATGPKLPTIFDIGFDMVIIDEAHLVLPTQVDADTDLSQFLYGLKNLLLTPNAIRLPMTGTPDRGKLENRYGHWRFLYPQDHRSYWSWARNNFVVTKGEWGGAEIGKVRNPSAWAQYDARHMIRRTKSEMLVGLPEKLWANDGGIDIPMQGEQADAYYDYMNYLEDKQAALLEAADAAGGNETSEGRKFLGKAQGLKLQFSLRSRQMATCSWEFSEVENIDGSTSTHGTPLVLGIAGSNKLAWILDWMSARGYLPEGWDPTLGKVVIVSYFTQILHWLRAELHAAGIASKIIDGDTPAVDKLANEAAFQRGDLRVILLSGHMGVSINLDAADDMIFVDSVHDPDKMEQAEDRIHRASRNHQVVYWRLASIDTADVVVLQVVDSRYRETRKTYDGDRGIAFARKMMNLEPKESAA